ncbi:MAG: CapA family protein [Clostridia bacterium]|nr:CapA family protein [Clostridia bacterium]
MGKGKRRGVSFGTIFMLLLTAAVIAATALFIFAIAGEGLYEKTGDLLRTFSEQGLFDMSPQETAAPRTAQERNLPQEQATPIPAFTAVATPTPVPQAATFTLAAAGTVYAPKAIRQSVQEGTDQFDFEPVFAGLGDTLSGADLAIATLETTTAGSEKGYGNYNTPTQLLDALRSCGVDMLSVATERALDKGVEGLRITQSELSARSLACAGAQTDAGDAGLIGIGGVKVAVLAYTYGVSDEGREKTRAADLAAVNLLDMERVTQDITRARVNGANVVIVLPHWGTKNKQATPDVLREQARQMAQAGADVILGTHPNVVLDTERLSVTRADGLTYEAVVCYSLGSLLTDARAKENTAGMVAHLSVTYDPVSRRTSLGPLACTPVYIAQQRTDGGNAYRIVDTDNAQAVAALSEGERQAAAEAAELVRSITGQAAREEEGQG